MERKASLIIIKKLDKNLDIFFPLYKNWYERHKKSAQDYRNVIILLTHGPSDFAKFKKKFKFESAIGRYINCYLANLL